MTPFHIRRRLGKLIGGARKRRADPRYPVTFVLPDGSEHVIESEERYTLVQASQLLPSQIATACPDGSCGQCVVDVIDASGLAEPTDTEREVLEKWQKDAGPNVRLACHARVIGPGAKVRVRKLFDYEAIRGD